MREGFLKKQDNGRYMVGEIELSCGVPVEVKTPFGWLMMRVEHDGQDYFLLSSEFSFYPIKIYARFS